MGTLKRTPLKRSGKLKRSPLGHATALQREKVRDRACLVCAQEPCDPAHLIARGSSSTEMANDLRAVIPLCRACHFEFDRGSLDLLPHLEPHWRAEMAFAVEQVGLLHALRRITGWKWQPVYEFASVTTIPPGGEAA